jgi:hypothetical protein
MYLSLITISSGSSIVDASTNANQAPKPAVEDIFMYVVERVDE